MGTAGLATAPLIVLDAVDSTQAEARRRLQARESGACWLLARRQTAGRGRKGRQWISPPGNLHLSLLLPLDDSGQGDALATQAFLPQLSFVAALAAHKALCAAAMRHGLPQLQGLLALKWPNDVLLAERKLGGILLEAETASAHHPPAVIIGWGVNLAQAPDEKAVRWPAVSLRDAGLALTPEVLARGIADAFARWFDIWRTRGFAPVREAWQARAWGMGRTVRFATEQAIVHGRMEGLDEDGALLLRTDEGTSMRFHAGEILHPGF